MIFKALGGIDPALFLFLTNTLYCVAVFLFQQQIVSRVFIKIFMTKLSLFHLTYEKSLSIICVTVKRKYFTHFSGGR